MDKLELPFVDGLPADGQSRLSWIHNGALLQGATKKLSNDGNLNLLAVQLQKNIVFLAENFDSLKATQDLSVEDIQKIKDLLDQAGTEGLIDLVNKNTEDLRLLKLAVDQLSADLIGQEQIIGDLTALVGTRSPESGPNNIFDDLLFIKTRIGNATGEDINGKPTAGITATGLILKIDDIRTQSNKNATEIDKINTAIATADLVQLHKNVDDIRIELGPKPAQGTPAVYTRLKNLEDSDIEINARLDEIRSDIGTGKIITKVNTNTSKISTLEAEINGTDGINDKLDALTVKIDTPNTGIDARLTKVTAQSDATTAIVGKTANDGLQKQVATLNTTIGIGITPLPAASVLGRLDLVEAEVAQQVNKTQEIEVVLGTSTTGLQGASAKHEKAIYGNTAASDPVEKIGVMAATKSTVTAVNDVAVGLDALISKTPYKGKTLAILGDKTTNITNKNISDKSYITPHSVQVTGLTGVESISQDNNFVTAKTADIILINVGTYDYLFNTELGTIADAVDGHAGAPSFYSELYDLLVSVAAGTSRVFITTGYRVVNYDGTTVKYPAANGSGKKLDDYSTAIKEVAAMFSVPVIDTNNKLGVNTHNSTQFISPQGFTKAGIERFSTFVSNSIVSN